MVWMIWGGPFAVVVASMVTLVVAVKGGDEPLPVGQTKQVASEDAAMTPAVQARNQAAAQAAHNANR